MSYSHKTTFNIVIILAVILMIVFPNNTGARMLPTRSNEDQLDKLRELLRDVSKDLFLVKLDKNELWCPILMSIRSWCQNLMRIFLFLTVVGSSPISSKFVEIRFMDVMFVLTQKIRLRQSSCPNLHKFHRILCGF